MIEQNIEGTCSIKDVGIDTIHILTQSLEEKSETSSDHTDDSDNSPTEDSIYSAENLESSHANNEDLCTDHVDVESQYEVQSNVEDDSTSLSTGSDLLNINMNSNNHD